MRALIGLKPAPSQHLLVLSQQWNQQAKILNMFKVNKENTRKTSSFFCLHI